MAESTLLFDDGTIIWHNSPAIGHHHIKLRKQIREDEIVDRMLARFRQEREDLSRWDDDGGA